MSRIAGCLIVLIVFVTFSGVAQESTPLPPSAAEPETAPSSNMRVVRATEVGDLTLGANRVLGSGLDYGCSGCTASGYFLPYDGGTGATKVWNTGAFDLIFGTGNAERLRVTSSGNVGIGTTTPDRALVVNRSNQSNYLKVMGSNSPLYDIADWWTDGTNHVFAGNMRASTGLTGAFSVWTGGASRVNVLSSGLVGIGVTDPSQLLEVNGNVQVRPATGSFSVGGAAPSGYQFFISSAAAGAAAAMQLKSKYFNWSTSYIGNFGTYGTYISHNRDPLSATYVDAAAAPNESNAAYIIVGDTNRSRLFQVMNHELGPVPPALVEKARLVVKYNGYVGIGTTEPTEMLDVQGNINVSGNINAKYQDIAEWVPSSNDLDPGTVVVLDAALGNGVMASTTAYDTKVAGVVSAQPGITLGESGASKEQVATTGRVRVKVDATRVPIAVGDLLVTSDRPGYAMKSVPVEMAGISMHRPGTIVGKALEALTSGEGEILVLLSLQ